ncbi:MAG: DNA recombination protein RmuC [Candidatus Vogelbacteria bacterium]|nr:DNA recombination protein RmuC [Candidatus Vogelbacteria bacterium]
MILYITLGVIVGVVGGAVVVWLLLNKTKEGSQVADQSMLLLQNQLQDLIRTVDQKLSDSSTMIQTSMQGQFGESQKLVNQFLGEITKMTEKVTRVEETGKQMIGFADQLQNMQDIFKNPKQRGVIGEYYLETLLKNVLPTGSYQMQYPFSDGTIVDAVVFVKDKIIPVDSKFSLENYNRLAEERDPLERERLEKLFKTDLKNRIDETAKYVKPNEKTMDFAFMFIPHEAVYYDLLVTQVGAVKVNTRDLVEYAFKEKHVIIVSPTSFLAYLQTVLQGLKALQIEEQAVEIRKRVEDLGKHIGAYDEYLKKLGNALGTTVSHYNTAYKEFKKVDKDVLRVTGVGGEIEPIVLDKPQIED